MSLNAMKIFFLAVVCLGIPLLAPTVGLASGSSIDGQSIYQLGSRWARQDGKQVSLGSLKGHYVIMAMIYTSCQGACPLIIADLKKMDRAIPRDRRSKVRFALFSLDPARDTVAKLKAYALVHDLDLHRWSLYHGKESDVRALSAVLGFQYRKDADGGFEHSNLITLLDPVGRIAAQLSGIGQDPAPILSAIP
jgi:protein SCO1/2